MKAKIELVDGCAVVTFPASIASSAGLFLDFEVDIRAESGCIVLTQPESDSLIDRLIDGITPANVHKEIDAGGPVGAEAL